MVTLEHPASSKYDFKVCIASLLPPMFIARRNATERSVDLGFLFGPVCLVALRLDILRL